jgi:3-deoxy-D-manno-octulosonic-acid transferase
LQVILYNIFLWLFRVGTAIASLFDEKARKWVRGRKDIFSRLKSAIPPDEKIVWIHCASLGEFEQGRPIIESIRANYPGIRMLLTFFSPSGYEARKNYSGADWIFYLPMDSPGNARKFLEIVHPSLVIFVKYEFWYYYLKKIKYRQIPLLLVSALFRRDMSFFKWYGGLQRKILSRFNRLFVQNASSKKLLDEIGLENITEISGDTRFDRVIEIARNTSPIDHITGFIASQKTIVAGSTWEPDETMISQWYEQEGKSNYKLILAPHEMNAAHITDLQKRFPGSALYSTWREQRNNQPGVLIIDNVGMLSRLYQYANLAYVGGGFSKTGIHNVLEPAVYGKPVIWGPHYKKYMEARGLLEAGGGFCITDPSSFGKLVQQLDTDPAFYAQSSHAARHFVISQAGATKRIMKYIQEKRLLTNW